MCGKGVAGALPLLSPDCRDHAGKGLGRQRGDTSVFPAAAQGSAWKQLQRRKVHFPGCRGPVQVCAGITASFRGDLAAASVAPEVNFPISPQIQRQKA